MIRSRKEVDPGLIDRQIVHYENYDSFYEYGICFCDTLPAMGYKSYLIREGAGEVWYQTSDRYPEAENEYYRIRVETNGTLTVLNKQTNCEFHRVLLLEDQGDDGDEYDFSPLPGDAVLTSRAESGRKNPDRLSEQRVSTKGFPQDRRAGAVSQSVLQGHTWSCIRIPGNRSDSQDYNQAKDPGAALVPAGPAMAEAFRIIIRHIRRESVDPALQVLEQENA